MSEVEAAIVGIDCGVRARAPVTALAVLAVLCSNQQGVDTVPLPAALTVGGQVHATGDSGR